MATGGGEGLPQQHVVGFYIPLQIIQKKEQCPGWLMRRLFSNLKNDIHSLCKQFERNAMEFVKPCEVTFKGDCIYIHFTINDVKELKKFRDHAKEHPVNKVSDELELFLACKSYGNIIDIPKDTKYCLHMSRETYENIKKAILDPPGDDTTTGSVMTADMPNETEKAKTAADDKPCQMTCPEKEFVIYLPRNRYNVIDCVYLVTAYSRYKLDNTTNNMYSCTINMQEGISYWYHIYYYNGIVGRVFTNALEYTSKIFKSEIQPINRELLDNTESELKAHLIDIIKDFQTHNCKKRLCMDIEYICSRKVIIVSKSNFLQNLWNALKRNKVRLLCIAILMGNICNEAEIDNVYFQQSDALLVAEELCKLTLDKLSPLCCKYMPVVCHKLYNIAKGQTYSCVSEISFFSKFLGKERFYCLDTCAVIAECDDDAVHIYTELKSEYKSQKSEESLKRIEILLKHSPISFSISTLQEIDTETDNFLIDIVKKGVYQRVEHSLNEALRRYNVTMLYDYWNDICKSEDAKQTFKITVEAYIKDILVKQQTVTDSIRHYLTLSNGLFDDINSQEELLKAFAKSHYSTGYVLFIDLQDSSKFKECYHRLTPDCFVNWLDCARHNSKQDRGKFVNDFVEVLRLTETSPSIQTVLCDSFFKHTGSDIKELLSLWSSLEGVVNHHVGDTIVSHLLKTLKGEKQRNPHEVLQYLCGDVHELHVSTMWTVSLISELLQTFCPIKKDDGDEAILSSVMQNVKMWNILVHGMGSCYSNLNENQTYAVVCEFFKRLAKMTLHQKMSYKFVKAMLKHKEHKIEIFGKILQKHSTSDIGFLNRRMEQSEEKYKMGLRDLMCVIKAMERIKKNVDEDELPHGFQSAFERKIEQKETLPDLSFDRYEMLFQTERNIFDTCICLEELLKSQVFWNVYSTIPVEDITVYSIRLLFKSDDCVYPETCDVTNFFEMMCDVGVSAFKRTWCTIQVNSDLTIGNIKALFREASNSDQVANEIRLAEKICQLNLSATTVTTLQNLTMLHEIANDFKGISRALEAFNLDNEEFRERFSIIDSLYSKERKESDGLHFHEVNDKLRHFFLLKQRLSTTTLAILHEIGCAKSLIEFLKTIIDEDIRNLIDAVDDISEEHVQESTVSGLIDIKSFLHPLLSRDYQDAEHFFTAVQERTHMFGDKSEKLSLKLHECMENLHKLKALYRNVANRGEQTKETIKKILSEGQFTFSLCDETHTTSVKCVCPKNKSVYAGSTLVDLRSRALLLMNSERARDDKICNREDLSKFVLFIDQSLEIKVLIGDLYYAGHIDYETYSPTSCGKDLKMLQGSLRQDLTLWEADLKSCRKSHYLLNFVQSVQLHSLFDYMKHKQRQQQVGMILKFIDPDFCLSNWNVIKTEETDDTGASGMLQMLGRSLEKSFDQSKFDQQEKIESESKAKRIARESVQKGKFLLVKLDEKSVNVVKTVLAVYENTTMTLPKPYQIIFCCKDTTWDEIRILLNRCELSKGFTSNDTLYCLANVELLSNELQFKLVEALRQLNSSSQYLLCVVCRGGKNQLFIDEFSDRVMTMLPSSESNTETIFRNKYPDVLTVSSDIAGLGKTATIKCLAGTVRQNIVTLHISGNYKKKTLIQQLNNLNLRPYNALHIDIAAVSDIISLDTFLFELLFLRYVTTGIDSYHLTNDRIYIEVANTMNSLLRNSLQTAMCFKRKHLKWDDFNDFIVSKERNSPTQVVCMYLDALDRNVLDSTDIILTGKDAFRALPEHRCKSLLAKHIPMSDDLSFVIVHSFLNVVADQLKKLSSSSFFKVLHIKDMVENNADIKRVLVSAIVDVSVEFATRSISGCRERQLSTLTTTAFKEDVESMIRWEDSNHLIYIFHSQNIQTLSAMYRDKSKVPAHVKCLFESQMKKQLLDFDQMNQEQFQTMLQRVARTNPSMLNPDHLKKISTEYALTPDNLLKMVLIIMRIRANVPVVVMGETGCGKTSLIRYLAGICEIPCDVLNVHAGTSLGEIIATVKENDFKASSNLKTERWLFLDEINTSQHVNAISDVICHHNLYGKQLSPNLVILSACNPYKMRTVEAICTAGLKAKGTTDEMSRLVYRVLPLPQQLVDYVWDFGSLSKEDECVYIRRMVHDVFSARNYLDVLVELVSMSQEYIRNIENSYTVSLRDVQRCRTLTKSFSKMLKYKKSKCGQHPSDIIAIILAVAHCYLTRLTSRAKRKDFLDEMSRVLDHFKITISSDAIYQIISTEQRDILNRMELPQGTAKNVALQENVFMILNCILNKIPIFVVGKPGCSKSLAMQVIRSNLRGKDSKDAFLKTLPQIYCVSFQGSESSTSDGILKVFEKAETYQNSNPEDVLSVVVLDEIGLAEVSRFNPLKVLHSLLEPGGASYPNVAVVGISNWALDASKMNRAVHLSRPDMDQEELFETGKSISQSFEGLESKQRNMIKDKESDFSTQNIEDILRKLAYAYCKYSLMLNFANFHGLRDYYALIKYVAKKVSETTPGSHISSILRRGLERNFGGRPSEKGNLIDAYKDCVSFGNEHLPVIDIITENIDDTLARHLMLITSGQSDFGILKQRLKVFGRMRYELIHGSQFEEDLTDDYNYRILSRIILCMEEGIILILKDLDTVYGSLYDMLNQNYTIIGKTKHCRVALGHYSNPICRVSDTFRCIVLVDESNVNYQDPPFLNRFEKQMLRFSDILTPEQENIITRLEAWVTSLSDVKGERFDKKDLFPIYNRDLLASLVLKFDLGKYRDTEEIDERFEKCKLQLMWILKPDAVIRLTNIWDRSMTDEAESIRKWYFELHVHEGLIEFHKSDLENNPKKNLLRIIFTYASVHTNALRILKSKWIQKDYVGSFKSEKQLSTRIKQFWNESDASLLCMQCSVKDDGKHVMLVMSTIEHYRREYVEKNPDGRKHVYLILHMSRLKETSGVVSHINFLSDWKLVTMDCLDCPRLKLPELCRMSLFGRLNTMRPLHGQITKQLFWAFTRIKYSMTGRGIQSIHSLVDRIKSCQPLLQFLDDYMWSIITTNSDSTDWQLQVASDRQMMSTSTGIVDALEMHLQNQIRSPLAQLIYHLEVHAALDSFLIEDLNTDDRRKLWTNITQDHNVFNIKDVPVQSGPECYACDTSDLSFKTPFFKFIYHCAEGIKGEFMKMISLLKERLSYDKDEILPYNVINEVIIVHQPSLVKDLPRIEPGYSNICDNYVDDFCNMLSAFCIGITGNNRIAIARNLILQKTKINVENFCQTVLNIHSAVWLHPHLFSTQMQILDICSAIIDSELPKGNGSDEQVHGRLTIEHSNVEYDETENEQVLYHRDDEMTLHDPKDQPYLVESETVSQFQEGLPEHKDSIALSEESFVELICRKLLPTSENIMQFPGIDRWSQVTSRTLPLAATVSNKPLSLDMLRFCFRIAEHIIRPFCIDSRILIKLADELNESDSFIDENVFHCVMEIVRSAKDASTLELQRVVSDYLVKCLFNHPSEEYLEHLYRLIIQAELPDKNCSTLKLVVLSAIENELDSYEDVNQYLQYLLQEGERYSLDEHPFFATMNTFLEELNSQNRTSDPFVLLLVDIFESKYKTLIEGLSLQDACSLFLTSHTNLQQSMLSTKYITSVACFKAFIMHVISTDQIEAHHDAINTIFTHGLVKESMIFFNCLRETETSFHLCRQLDGLQSSLPSLKEIDYSVDLFQRSCYDCSPLCLNIPKSELQGDSHENDDTELLRKATTPEGLLSVYHVLLKDFYIARTYKTMDDTSKHRANFIIKKAGERDVSPPHLKFMACLLGRQDFKIGRFMHTPESSSRQCFINTTVTVLYSVLLSYQSDGHQSLLQSCLLDPLKIKTMFLPGFPCSEKYCHQIPKRKCRSEVLVSCTCDHRVCPNNQASCFVCKSVFKTKDPTSLYTDTTHEKTGWVYSDTMERCDYSSRELSPVACNIYFLFLKACLLGSYAVGISDGDALDSLLDISEIDLEVSMIHNLECHWQNLLQLLNIGDYSLSVFIQRFILKQTAILSSDGSTMHTSEGRRQWENTFSKEVNEITSGRFDHVSQALVEHLELNNTDTGKMQIHVGEIAARNEYKESLAIFRIAGSPSHENFLSELFSIADQFPILDLIVQMEKEIHLVVHLNAIIQWHLVVVSSCNYNFKKRDFIKMTVTDFVHSKEDKKQRELLKEKFEALRSAWTNICNAKQFGDIQWASTMAECIILDENSQIYNGLKFLTEIQNEVIDTAMCIASENNSMSLFTKDADQVAVHEVPVMQLTTEMMIQFDDDNDIDIIIVQESQCDPRYGYGRHVIYDFQAIEKALIADVLTGKVYIQLDFNLLPRFAFTDEVFRNISLLTQNIRDSVKQECLTSDIVRDVKDIHDKNPKMITQLLNHVGIVLTLLKKTHGDPDQTVAEYVDAWKNLLASDFPFDLLPRADLKLCQVVALYELLEELNAVIIIDSLEDDYKLDLHSKDNDHFKDMVTTQFVLAEMLLKALKRFIHRTLDNRDADIKLPLQDYISNSSFWPHGILSDGIILIEEQQYEFTSVLPAGIMVGHICGVVSAITKEIECKGQGRLQMDMISGKVSSAMLGPRREEKRKHNLKSKRKY